jgi:hypothetical protein
MKEGVEQTFTVSTRAPTIDQPLENVVGNYTDI